MKYTIVITLFLLTFGNVWAQNDYPCVNNVSTDANNPFNNSLPYVSPPLNSNLFLNSFKWWDTVQPLPQYPTNNMLNLTHMENAFASSMGSYYLYITSDPLKPTFANGWELLAVNLGYFPDGTPLANYSLKCLPLFYKS